MTTDEALARLRPDWTLSKDAEDYQSDELGWAVHSQMNGEMSWRLGWGKTIVEAIEAAEAKVEQEEREQAARDADYARRKAAGQLTPLERAGEYTTAMWSREVAIAVEIESKVTIPYLANLVNRSYEREITSGQRVVVPPEQEKRPH